MPDRWLYLAINTGVILVPLIFSFHPRIRFYREWGAFAMACGLTAIPFLIWDIAFTEAGVWGFNPRYVSGIPLFGLPLEECLFFLCIPYACVFVFFCFGKVRVNTHLSAWMIGSAVMGVILIILAMMYREKAYTFLTFLLTGIVLGYLSVFMRPAWLPRAIVCYIAVIPFFLISNGLLTGSWIEEQVVWYDDTENLGIRMGTIPVEDTFYGFLLILLNVFLFERIRMKRMTGKS